MRSKAKLVALLTVIVAASAQVVVMPQEAEASNIAMICPNTSCYGGPYCTYDPGWGCFLGPLWCDGNERC